MGDLKLTWAGIRSIEYTGINTEMARLTAANGDVYEAQFAVASLGVETSFGRTELPVQLIRSIKVSAAGQSGQLSSGLVARWLGDGDAKDSAGHFDGQASGGLRYVPGPAGQAFQFNGGDAQVDFGNSAGNFGKGDFTIVFWIRTTSRNPYEAFLSKRPTCDAAFSHWNIFVGSRTGDPTPGFVHCGIAEGGYKDPSGNALFSSRPINDGQWHHVAWVRQSTSSGSCTGLIYMDGALDNSMTYLQAFDIANQAPLLLGRNVCEGHDACRPYSGAAADLQLFSQALSADEIIAIYQAGKSGK
jgi:hypothetical protein